MLTLLGVATILVLLVLILFRITSALVALILVPIVAAIVGGFGSQVGTFAMDGIRSVVPVASLFAFAVLYFGVMNDAGLFDPIIRGLVGLVGTDPVKIAVGTVAIMHRGQAIGVPTRHRALPHDEQEHAHCHR